MPQPETGNIVPFNNHGTYIYITHFQASLQEWTFIIGGVAIVVSVVLVLISKNEQSSEAQLGKIFDHEVG